MYEMYLTARLALDIIFVNPSDRENGEKGKGEGVEEKGKRPMERRRIDVILRF